MRKILMFICLIVSVQMLGSDTTKVFKLDWNRHLITYYTAPANYSFINARYRWIGGMFDSGLHIPSYNGTPSGTRSSIWPWDGAIAMDTTNHRLYIFSGNAWIRQAAFSEVGSTYTANLPVRITGTVFSADTSYAFVPSLTTNSRLQKIIDSLNAAGGFGTPTLQQVADAGSIRSWSSSGVGITISGTGADDGSAALQIGQGVNGIPIYLTNQNFSPLHQGGEWRAMHFERDVVGGSTADGLAIKQTFLLETSSASDTATKVVTGWKVSNHTNRTAFYDIRLVDSGTLKTALQIQPDYLIVNNLTDTLATLQDVRDGGGGGSGTDLSSLDTLPQPRWNVTQDAGGTSYKTTAPTVIYATDYGVVADGVTDDWAGLMAALQACNDAGGGTVILPLGKMITSRVIKFPLNAFDSTDDLRSITLTGQMFPNMVSEPLTDKPHPQFGSIIEGNFLGDSAIIDTYSSVGTWGDFNFLNITIENLAIRVRSKTGATDVAAEGTGINASKMAMVQINNVSVSITSNIFLSVQPASTAYGILFPATNNFVSVNANNIFITGFYYGAFLREHATMDNVFIDACYYGLYFGTTNHSMHVGKACVARTKYNIGASAGVAFTIDNLSMEDNLTSGAWWENTLDLNVNAAATGYIKYQRVITGSVDNDVLRRSNVPYNIIALPFNENTPQWATANRPDIIPEASTIMGYNTDSSFIEVYDHATTSWLPAAPGGTGSGSSTWNGITDPTGTQTLSFGDAELTAHTNGSDTETFWTTTSNSLTTGTVYSLTTNSMTTGTLLNLTSTSTALSGGNEGLNIAFSGANSNNVITVTGARVSVTNTNASGSTNIGLNVTASGASTDNIALQATGRLDVTTASTITALTATSSGQFNTAIILNNTDSRQMNIQWRRNNTVAWQIGHDFAGNTTNDFYWYDAVNAKNKLYFLSSTGAVHIGANAYSAPGATFQDDKRAVFFGRVEQQQGADVASAAGAITLGSDGNAFEITGTDAITLISNLTWQNGSVITLLFTSTASLTDGTANSGTNIGMELNANTNFTGSAGASITLMLSEIGGTQRWREIARSVN